MTIKCKYSRFIPSIYKEAGNEASFMERYLKIFEDILRGINPERMEESSDRLDMISGLFHPGFTFLFDENTRDFILPIDDQHNKKFRDFFSIDLDEYLVWFAGWMALSLKENWDRQTRREILSKIFPLYKIRGTKKGLEEYLKLCTGYNGYGVEIIDDVKPFQVGRTSHVGKDTTVGGLPPDHFIVNLTIQKSDNSVPDNREMIEELINMEKPVHTTFKLNIKYV